MIRKPIQTDLSIYPAAVEPFLRGAQLYDSSCSPNAQVLFVDKDGGYFLKTAPKGTLAREAEMTRYFHGKALAANVLTYLSDERDWLLTEQIRGDDCVAAKYLEQPERLCEIFAQQLALLHRQSYENCPVMNHTARYLASAERNYQAGHCDIELFPADWSFATPDAAYRMIKQRGHLLQTDTLLHGDYCLPNIILDNWSFSGLIDLDNGGVGDRHVDLFWAIWTLFYNLKTNRYRERFLDAYGRDQVDEERLRLIAAIEIFG